MNKLYDKDKYEIKVKSIKIDKTGDSKKAFQPKKM